MFIPTFSRYKHWASAVLFGALCLLPIYPAFANKAFSGLSVPATAPESVPIPGTATRIELPPGWTSGPGEQGAVLRLDSPDLAAQISLNVMQPDNGMTLPEFQKAIEAGIHENMLSTGFLAEEGNPQIFAAGSAQTRLYRYTLPDPTDPLVLEIGYVVVGDHLLVSNFTSFSSAVDHLQAGRASLLSVGRPGAMEAGNSQPPLLEQPPRTSPSGNPDLNAREQALMRRLETAYSDKLARELAEVRAALAFRLEEAGDYEGAFATLQTAARLHPGQADYLEGLGDLLDYLPQPAAPFLAQSYYEEALAVDPGRRACRIKLAASYQATGELRDARDHYEVLMRNPDGLPDARFLQEWSLCAFALDEEQRAVEFLAEMVKSGGGPAFSLFLGIFLNEQGHSQDAAAMARYAAQLATDAAFRAYAESLATKYAGQGGAR